MVGELIRAARKARGWTQEELARQAGVSLHAVMDIERGTLKRRTPQVVRRLVEFLDIAGDPPRDDAPRPWRWHGMKGKQ